MERRPSSRMRATRRRRRRLLLSAPVSVLPLTEARVDLPSNRRSLRIRVAGKRRGRVLNCCSLAHALQCRGYPFIRSGSTIGPSTNVLRVGLSSEAPRTVTTKRACASRRPAVTSQNRVHTPHATQAKTNKPGSKSSPARQNKPWGAQHYSSTPPRLSTTWIDSTLCHTTLPFSSPVAALRHRQQQARKRPSHLPARPLPPPPPW